MPIYKFCRKKGINIVTTFHEVPHPLRLELFFKKSPFFLNRFREYRMFKAWIRKIIYQWIMKHSSTVIVHTEEAKTLLESWGYDNVFRIPHGTEILNVKVKRNSGIFTLVSFGDIRIDKRYDLVFYVVRKLKQIPVTYKFIQDHQKEEVAKRWLEYISRKKPDNVKLIVEYLPKNEFLRLIASADAALFPYDK